MLKPAVMTFQRGLTKRWRAGRRDRRNGARRATCSRVADVWPVGPRGHETPHQPHRAHRRQIQVLGIGKCVWCGAYYWFRL